MISIITDHQEVDDLYQYRQSVMDVKVKFLGATKAKLLGAHFYLTKPATLDQLKGILSQ